MSHVKWVTMVGSVRWQKHVHVASMAVGLESGMVMDGGKNCFGSYAMSNHHDLT
jgi:hypothetical protein